MLEGVSRLWEEGRLVDEFRRLQMSESTAQLLLRPPDDRDQQRERDILADDGARLQDALVLRRKPIDAGGQNGLDRRRDLDVGDGSCLPICATLAREHPGLDESPDALLDEQWVALRLRDQLRLQPIKCGLLAEETSEHLTRALGRQRIEPYLGVIGPRAPAMLVVGTIVDEQEHGRRGEAFDKTLEKGLRLAVDPVQILEDQKERLH